MSTTTADRIQLPHLAELCVRRSGISFHNVAPDRVLIEIEVENRGGEASRATQLRLEAAPLGAFVPWRSLTTVRVPAIAPGTSTWVRTVARQPRPQPIGKLTDILPSGLLVAARASENQRPVSTGEEALPARLLLTLLGSGALADTLPPDMLDLLDGPRPHWAGNLNVWIGRRPVERHRAPRLLLHPGRTNLAVFDVGDGPDHYSFRIECSHSSWRSSLYDLGAGEAVPRTDDSIRQPRWFAVREMRVILFAVRPAEVPEHGSAVVHVTQRSSGKTALVEFDLDPAAQGPGCCTI